MLQSIDGSEPLEFEWGEQDLEDYDRPIRARVCFYNEKRQSKRFWNGIKEEGRVDLTAIITGKELEEILASEPLERRSREVNDLMSRVRSMKNVPTYQDPEAGMMLKIDFDPKDPSRFTIDLIETLARIQESFGGYGILVKMDISEATREQAFEACILTAMMDMEVVCTRNGRTTTLRAMPRIVYLGKTQTDVLMGMRNRGGFIAKDLTGKGRFGPPGLIESESNGRAIVGNLSKYGLLDKEPMKNRIRGRNPIEYRVNYDGRVMGLINTRIVDGSRYKDDYEKRKMNGEGSGSEQDTTEESE